VPVRPGLCEADEPTKEQVAAPLRIIRTARSSPPTRVVFPNSTLHVGCIRLGRNREPRRGSRRRQPGMSLREVCVDLVLMRARREPNAGPAARRMDRDIHRLRSTWSRVLASDVVVSAIPEVRRTREVWHVGEVCFV
jgi:hypothetical protein